MTAGEERSDGAGQAAAEVVEKSFMPIQQIESLWGIEDPNEQLRSVSSRPAVVAVCTNAPPPSAARSGRNRHALCTGPSRRPPAVRRFLAGHLRQPEFRSDPRQSVYVDFTFYNLHFCQEVL